MTQNNVSILSDVSTCLRDAMDTMFDNNHNVLIPENNSNGSLSAEALKLMMNKRKLDATNVINEQQIYEENEGDTTKRLCTINGHQNQQTA